MHSDKPSATAILILKSMVFLSLDPKLKHLVPEDIRTLNTNLLKTKSLNKNRLIKIFEQPGIRNFIWALERLLLPGIILHYLLRKRYIEEATLKIINKGEVDQIVVLAAGFDSLAYRLSNNAPKGPEFHGHARG